MTAEVVFEQSFPIEGGNFQKAGRASGEIKRILKEIGLPAATIRRVAIAVYEAEMNVVAYAHEGRMTLRIDGKQVQVVCEDRGPGIADIELAMQEGYSTATDRIREMGFGAGMGLPNIKKNTDRLVIESEVDVGTRLEFEVEIA